MGASGDELMVMADAESLMVPSAEDLSPASDAGLGSEMLEDGSAILPRINLLQQMSKAITGSSDDDPPKAGTYWLMPFNRPLTLKPDQVMNIVVVQIFNSQRLWTPLDQGGGMICESSDGSLIASSQGGLAGAKLELQTSEGKVAGVRWSGGHPTDECRKCVFGLAAGAAASGRTAGKNPWLPKVLEIDGKRYNMPDELRAPKCQSGIDALVLVLAPKWREMRAEIVPAFVSFNRSSFPAGRSLAGMIKIASGVPAWGKIYSIGSKKITNERGTFFVSTVKPLGSTKAELMAMARELYENSKSVGYRSRPDDILNEAIDAGLVDEGARTNIEGDQVAPDDAF